MQENGAPHIAKRNLNCIVNHQLRYVVCLQQTLWIHCGLCSTKKVVLYSIFLIQDDASLVWPTMPRAKEKGCMYISLKIILKRFSLRVGSPVVCLNNVQLFFVLLGTPTKLGEKLNQTKNPSNTTPKKRHKVKRCGCFATSSPRTEVEFAWTLARKWAMFHWMKQQVKSPLQLDKHILSGYLPDRRWSRYVIFSRRFQFFIQVQTKNQMHWERITQQKVGKCQKHWTACQQWQSWFCCAKPTDLFSARYCGRWKQHFWPHCDWLPIGWTQTSMPSSCYGNCCYWCYGNCCYWWRYPVQWKE